jgi:ribose transport system substrate-binding protein
MKNKNIFILVVAFILLMTLMTSTSALIMSGVRDDKVEVSVVLDDAGHGRWASFLSGAEQAAKDTGVRLKVVSSGKNASVNQQHSLISEEINNGADGIILQVAASTQTENMISDIGHRAVLVLVDSSADMEVDVEGRSACIEANNIEIGRALANEVRITLGNDLSGHTIGIIAGNKRLNSLTQRMDGFIENIESSGAEILWTDNSVNNILDNIEFKQKNHPADILVALDNNGLETACELVLRTEKRPYIFGEGTSIKNVSYLDDGLITSMVVPNEYYMGYQSVSAVVKRLENRLTPMQNEVISYRVVNRQNLFDESNQRMLFPVVE